MAQSQFPGSIEILDFFHLSEYVWAVAKAAYPQKEQIQKDWVKTQQQLLKRSQWQIVIQNSHKLNRNQKNVAEGVMALRAAYLSNSNRWSNFWSPESKMFESKLA
jgi:hypothetical protein